MAYKMKGSPMQRNFGIKPSPVKIVGIASALAAAGTWLAGLVGGGAAGAAGTAAAGGVAAAGGTQAAGLIAAKAAAAGAGKAAMVAGGKSAIVPTLLAGASKLGGKKQHVQAPNKTAGMGQIMKEKER